MLVGPHKAVQDLHLFVLPLYFVIALVGSFSCLLQIGKTHFVPEPEQQLYTKTETPKGTSFLAFCF